MFLCHVFVSIVLPPTDFTLGIHVRWRHNTLQFNSYVPELVPIFYSAIKHGFNCFIFLGKAPLLRAFANKTGSLERPSGFDPKQLISTSKVPLYKDKLVIKTPILFFKMKKWSFSRVSYTFDFPATSSTICPT